MTQPRTKCIFDALICFEAGFLMTRQKHLYLMHYYVEKQVFLMTRKKVRICCIKRFEAGFLMRRQKLFYLMH